MVKQTCLPSTFALCFYEAWLAIKLALIFWTNFPKPGIGGWTFLAVHECFILFQFIKYLNSWSNNFNWSKPLKPSFLFCPWPFLLVSSHKIMVCDHLKCWSGRLWLLMPAPNMSSLLWNVILLTKQVDFCGKVFASDGQLSELHDDQQINLQFGDIMH